MPKRLSDEQKAFNKIISPEMDLRTQEDITAKPKGNSLFNWVRWFITQEVIGTGKSDNTVSAVYQELQKFINYFYKRFPAGDYNDWTRQVTIAFIKAMTKAKYTMSSKRRTFAYVQAFASYMNAIGKVNYESHPTRGTSKFLAPDKKEDDNEPESLRILSKGGTVIDEGRPVYELMKSAAMALTKSPRLKPSSLPYRDLAILTTLYYTGLRAHEICLLQMNNIDYANDGGIWFKNIKRKGDKEGDNTGQVYLRASGAPYLDDYIEHERSKILDDYKNAEQFIFLRYRGNKMERADIWSIIRDLAQAATSPEMRHKGYRIVAHPHSLRHERTYSLLQSGLSEVKTAKHLGHKSTKYIARYSQRSQKTMEEEIENLPD